MICGMQTHCISMDYSAGLKAVDLVSRSGESPALFGVFKNELLSLSP